GMAVFAVPEWIRGHASAQPVALSIPSPTLLNLNILGKMAFGALSGFEAVAIFSGELRGKNAAALIRRSVWISAPLVTTIFVLGSACVLVFSQPQNIDLIAPISQVISAG